MPGSGLASGGDALPVLSVQASAPVPGTYRGLLPDGRVVFQTLRVISPDLITLMAHDHTAQPVAYRQVGPALFRNAGGAAIELLAPSELRWTRGDGWQEVLYSLAP